MGLMVFREIFLDISLIQSECGKYLGIFHIMLSVSKNIVLYLNNVMEVGLCLYQLR